MAKCNEITFKMIYDNDDEHKSSNAESEKNLHCKHPACSPVLLILTICNVGIIIIDTIKIRRIIIE